MYWKKSPEIESGWMPPGTILEKIKPNVRIELTTSALQVRCSATKLIRLKIKGAILLPFLWRNVGRMGLSNTPWKTWASIPLPLACKASALPFELDSQNKMHHPVIETGARPWKGHMLPLHQWCIGPLRESNPRPLPPKGRIIPLDQAAVRTLRIELSTSPV